MNSGLADRLRTAWNDQLSTGFLLGDPHGPVETRHAVDPATGVEFRLRWLPHRELRGDLAALERLGILAPGWDEGPLLSDPRDPHGRHCSLCPANIAVCFPTEILVPIEAGGRTWQAGANFAWLGNRHFTVIAERHEDQTYSRSILEAAVDIGRQTEGAFRVIFNEWGAGASIPWHLHLQVTSDPFPIERLRTGAEQAYPTPIFRFPIARHDLAEIDARSREWIDTDPDHHRVNLLILPEEVIVVPRDARHLTADNKGEMGGYEMAGDFAFSDPTYRPDFDVAGLATARSALGQIVPPALR